MGVGRHVFLEKVDGRKSRQTQTAATDATDGLGRSLQESLLGRTSLLEPCSLRFPPTTGSIGTSNISYSAPLLGRGNLCCTSFVHE
jgi:hypothetical protein